MKFIVLLALAGLASCSTSLIGGDQARDVKIQYTYVDENGKEVKVELEADRLGLALAKDGLRPVNRKPAQAAPVRFVAVEQPEPKVETRFVQLVEAPQPRARPQLLRLVPAPEPKPQAVETRFIQVPAAPKPVAQRRFVQVQAVPKPVAQPRLVQLQQDAAPKPEPAVVKFVPLEQEIEVETKFIRVPVPVGQTAPAPAVPALFTAEVEEEIPVVLRATSPRASPVRRRSQGPGGRQVFRRVVDLDSSAEK
ncbi:protein TonB-like [Macrobrachium nipponense]|uniref:protein TonB-like n=1 Tax=Macrobrachium nipponense TaxID=159736 RepID=UPI0030C87E90